MNWCEDEACENKVKEETTATLRCLPFDSEAHGECPICHKKAKKVALFAKAY